MKYIYNSIEEVIQAAIEAVTNKHNSRYEQYFINDPSTVSDFLLLNHKQEKFETFSAIFLSSKNQIIAFEKLFSGSINSAQVYPRTVAQKCLEHNAAAIIFVHHHPSGDTTPSQSDIDLTEQLKKALLLIDVKVLDHFVLGFDKSFSMASHQMI